MRAVDVSPHFEALLARVETLGAAVDGLTALVEQKNGSAISESVETALAQLHERVGQVEGIGTAIAGIEAKLDRFTESVKWLRRRRVRPEKSYLMRR